VKVYEVEKTGQLLNKWEYSGCDHVKRVSPLQL